MPKPSVPSIRASTMSRTTLDSARAAMPKSENTTFRIGTHPPGMCLGVRTPPNRCSLTTNGCDRRYDKRRLDVATLRIFPASLAAQHEDEVTPDSFRHREVGV